MENGDNSQVQGGERDSLIPKLISQVKFDNADAQVMAIDVIKKLIEANEEKTASPVWEGDIEKVLSTNLVKCIVEQLDKGENEVQKEALECVSAISKHGKSSQIEYLVEAKVLPALCKILKAGQNDQIALIALSTLQKILDRLNGKQRDLACVQVEECDGLDALESLQTSENPEIHHKAFNLIDKYWGDPDDDSDSDAGLVSTLRQ